MILTEMHKLKSFTRFKLKFKLILKYYMFGNHYIALQNEITLIEYQYPKPKQKKYKKLFPYNKKD